MLKVHNIFFFLNTGLIFPVDGEEVKEKEILVLLRLRHKISYWEK